MSFDTLGLSADLLRAVSEQGYTEPTPIQARVIPVVLEARDVLAGAQTGTGKTAGFALPLLQRLAAAGKPQGQRRVRALILTPTRELAAQVGESVKTYGKYLPMKTAVVFGGVSINPQIEQLRRGVDILVATPGRLLDHASQRTVDLSHVEILVLDEADRMLDMGFLPDIRRVLALLPPRRQNLLFSATFPMDIQALANKLLSSPVKIEVATPNAAADLIEQVVYYAEKGEKRRLLSWLIGSRNWRQVLVFTRTKHGANRLAEQLVQDGLSAAAIHGNKSQGARTRALSDFKQGAIRVLVATDVASRGLDIDELPHVVNYELPDVPEHYVHRIGRTGRAGREGVAVSLVSNDERSSLKDIERLLRTQIRRETMDSRPPGTAGVPQMQDAIGGLSPAPRPAEGGEARRPGHYVKDNDGARRHGNSHGNRNQGAGRAEHRGHRSDSRGTGRPAGAAPPRGDGHAQRNDHGRPRGKSRAARRRQAAARANAGP
jgi:ATP-dependent RNA helicase RhlE